MSDDWLREHARLGRASDERSASLHAEDSERAINRKRAFAVQLPTLIDELTSELKRKVALYNETRGRTMLSIKVQSSELYPTLITIEGIGPRRRILYEVRADIARGTVTSYETHSEHDGRDKVEGMGTLGVDHIKSRDTVSLLTQTAGRLDPSSAADAALQRVLVVIS